MSESKPPPLPSSAKPSATANGQGRRTLTAEEAEKLNAIAKRMSGVLGDIVAIMMKARQHRYAFLSDLEWMVLPALATGQFAIAEGRHKESQLTSPRAVILWASVSKEVDQRLSANPGGLLRLKPAEWSSGSNAWLVDAVGDARAIKALVDQTLAGPLKGRTLKFVTRGEGGKPTVQAMKAPEGAAAAPTAKS